MSEVTTTQAAAQETKSVITKMDLLKAWFKWCTAVEVPVSFDRMQALAFGYSMNKILRKLYKDDPEAAARALTAAGFVMASELRTAGVDFTFAPVLDLDWGQSEIIGERSFALDPRVVTRLARALSHGMLMAGMANCGKHFPGHGYAAADSHVALPIDDREVSRIEHADVKPYTWMGIGLASVVTAHVVYPAYDEVPATFSKRILKGLLRDTLHFPGFVFSEAENPNHRPCFLP